MFSFISPPHTLCGIDGIQEMDQRLVKKDLCLTTKMESSEEFAAMGRLDATLKQRVIPSPALWLWSPMQFSMGNNNFLPSPLKKQSDSRSNVGMIFLSRYQVQSTLPGQCLVPRAVPSEPISFLQHTACPLPVASILPFAHADALRPRQVRLNPRALAGSGHPTSLGKWHKSLFLPQEVTTSVGSLL